MNFHEQKYRKDILKNILSNTDIIHKKLYKYIITDNKTTEDERRIGFLFETLTIILLISKCLKVEYTNILDGQLQSLKTLNNINILLKQKIAQGNNPSDITIKQNDKIIAFSIKYRNKFMPNQSSVSELDGELSKINENYSIGLIVKDKKLILEHNYKNDASNQKKLHSKVIEDNLLLDEKDIIEGLEVFCERFKNIDVDDFIEQINNEYLNSSRKQLKLKLHQKLTFLKFLRNKKDSLHLISHKPRSGKSITMLIICKYLLENGYDKILIMTSVPDTIKSFIKDLDEYIDFKNIKYTNQEEFKNISEDYKGIVFCSVQYLKTNTEEKKKYLKNIKFDSMIIDECHMGSSTTKTQKDILNVNIEEEINTIRSNIKMNIFASGTSDKTQKFYKIKNVYDWGIEDESYMKRFINNEINENDKNEIIEIMKKRHGEYFEECLNDNKLDKDYSKMPTQVLIKHSIPDSIIDDIKNYNLKNKTDYGYSCSSLFALVKNKKGYDDMFELESNTDGIELLKSFFDCIISSNKMNKNSIMRKIEETQSFYKSRLSEKESPKLFLMYLPTHTGNNNISQLQTNIKRFITKYKLWIDYNIEYTNSIDDSSDCKEEYNEYIKTILDKTKKDNKKGCILLLGNKGGVGITYPNCDVTISLDDGHNLDNQRQRFSRALTEAEKKTVGINVDMNIQRTYLFLNDIIHKHRKITKTTKTNGEILKYFYENNIFLFNPSEINKGNIKTFEITEYYNKEAQNILSNIDDTTLLNEIIVVDDDIILDKDEIALEFTWDNTTNKLEPKIINSDLLGEQIDCSKGLNKKINDEYEDGDNNSNFTDEENNGEITDKEDVMQKQKRILKEICSRVLFPLLSLLSRTYTNLNLKDMFVDENTKNIINDILKDKKIILNKNSYNSIIKIMNTNDEIINNIREIYQNAPANKIHQLIAKHFIPSIEEKKNNAEIPTPISLVEEMLDKMPEDFWKEKNKVFEPCCGKGNFVMKIFDKFFNGLSEKYPDEKKRCEIIISKCLYYSDITPMNVFITTEILKCEIQSRIGNDKELKYEFNSNIGNTLELDINKKWGFDKFDAVIGNPPYNNSQNNEGKKGGGDLLWNKFVIYSIDILYDNGYLIFVHPPGWRKPESEKSKFKNLFELMVKDNQMIYLEIHDTKDGMKVFNAGTRYDWYIIQKTKQYKKTTIKGEDNNICDIDLNNWNFLPNSNFDVIEKMLLNDNENCEIIYSRSNYGTDRKWISNKKTNDYKYELIHSTPQSGIRYMYSSKNDKGHFGIKKVIFGDSGIYNSIIDIDGKYGMTQHSMGIEIEDINEGNEIKKVLDSEEFKKILKSCSWSNFQIDWRLFTYFKKTFYKEIKIEKVNNDEEKQNKIMKRTKTSKTNLDDNKDNITNKTVKRSISKKIEKDIESNSEKKQKITKVKKNKSTVNK